MATIIKKNYKSDFDAILHLKSCVGDVCKEIGWPDCDWVARFYTTSHENVYIASNIGGVLTNCFNDNGNIHVVFNNHGLGSGTLRVEFSAEIPNEIYPDGSQLEVSPQALNIELVRGLGDCGTIVNASAMTPSYQKRWRDALTGVVLRRGYISNVSMPGEIYDGSILGYGINKYSTPCYSIKIRFPYKSSVVDITELFGKAFEPNHIISVRNGSWSYYNGRVRITASTNKRPEDPVIVRLPYISGRKYLTKNSHGQIVLAQWTVYDFQKTATPKPKIAYIPEHASPSFVFEVGDDGIAYEWQYRKNKKVLKKKSDDGEVSYKSIKKWRKLTSERYTNLFKLYRKSYIFRIRTITGKHKGEWRYGFLYKNNVDNITIGWL